MFKPLSLALVLSGICLAAAQAKETKVAIVLEYAMVPTKQCPKPAPRRVEECVQGLRPASKELRSQVFVAMELDPDCAGMAILNSDQDSFDSETHQDTDVVFASVTYLPNTNKKMWSLRIIKINGRDGPPIMNGEADSAKETAHKLCHIIHQAKITRR